VRRGVCPQQTVLVQVKSVRGLSGHMVGRNEQVVKALLGGHDRGEVPDAREGRGEAVLDERADDGEGVVWGGQQASGSEVRDARGDVVVRVCEDQLLHRCWVDEWMG